MQQTVGTTTFEGSDEERRLAEQIVQLARLQGRFFSVNAPINLKLDELVGFFASQDKGRDPAELAGAIDAALSANPAVFARGETDDGAVTFTTTRGGRAPVAAPEDMAHTLAERFMTPVELPPPPPPKPAPLISDAWTQPPDFVEEEAEEEAPPAEAPALVAPAAVEAPPAVAEAPEETPVAEAPAAVPEPAPAPALASPSPTEVPVEELRAALAARLEADDRFVSFGEEYYPEDLVDRYSRGDMRRIREYIQEVTEPLGDEMLLQDLFGRRPNEPTFAAARFSLDYRLSREKRDFEFVGTRDSRLWATPNLPPIGTTLRKASELGTDYRYLLDEPAAPDVGAAVTHTLTFFEWVYGVLPYDGVFRQLFPGPYLEDQKTAVLRFDVPQLFVSFLAELRYPTANRGGYLVGFDEFYRENLAPGAVMTIERTPDNNGLFVLRFTATPAREERLLQYDERRNRYVYRAQEIACEQNDEWVLSEARYPRLANVKPLEERERRRPEAVVGAAFERAAENVGTKAQPRYWSSPDELLPVANLERPFSRRALLDVLESPQYPQFTPDPDTEGAFFYEPPAAPAKGKRRAAEDADEDEDIE
ncbi:MAG TPA: hypothetical protein VFL91_30955 [Thermomicrobiales bacterium]|nr:hypothetical protein [Thermomicrobiales bacterium]